MAGAAAGGAHQGSCRVGSDIADQTSRRTAADGISSSGAVTGSPSLMAAPSRTAGAVRRLAGRAGFGDCARGCSAAVLDGEPVPSVGGSIVGAGAPGSLVGRSLADDPEGKHPMDRTGSTPAAVRTDRLGKRFGATVAVDDVTLTVERGEVFGFLGPNGAGKSTTIRMLLGLTRPTAGRAWVFDEPAANVKAAHRHLAYVPADVALWPHLTGAEILTLLAHLGPGVDERVPAGAGRPVRAAA